MHKTSETTIHSLKEMQRFAERVLEELVPHKKAATVVWLVGNLGSGKTTFVQFLADYLGVKDHVNSPTFVIMKKYPVVHTDFETLIHVDAYRIEDAEELRVLRFADELVNPKNLIVIEWADRVQDIFNHPYHRIDFTFLNDTSRNVVFSHHG